MKYNFYLVVLLLVLGACATSETMDETIAASVTPTALDLSTVPKATSITGVQTTVEPIREPTHLAYTYQQPDGNRLLFGQGEIPKAQPLDISLAGQPHWLVAAPLDQGSVWVAVLLDGQVQAFYVTKQGVEPASITPVRLPPGMPPLLIVKDDSPQLLVSPNDDASMLTHPVVLALSGEGLAFIAEGGDLVISHEREATRLPINALVDARVLQDEAGRLLLLTEPTTSYNHGVLGDNFEAESVTLIETHAAPRVASRIDISPPGVVEGIAPIWADLSGDGQREIIVTVSDSEQGSRIVVYNQEGQKIATGPAIGRGFRWRHQLVVAPFGPNGELELVDVLTPHIGGVVEFYRLSGDQLEIVAQVPGYSSHTIGSRNLDTALAGDLDSDDHIELLVPDQTRTTLGAIQRTVDGAEVVWTVPVGGKLSTNIAAVSFPDGSVAIGVGHEGYKLRLWLPH